MEYNVNIIVKTIDNNKFKFKEVIKGADENVLKQKIKGLIMKIARNGYYDFEDNDTLKNPTYYPPTSIISVKCVEPGF